LISSIPVLWFVLLILTIRKDLFPVDVLVGADIDQMNRKKQGAGKKCPRTGDFLTVS